MSEAVHLDAESLERMIQGAVVEVATRLSQSQGRQGGLAVPSAWVSQDAKQLTKYGEKRASWYCYWIDPEKRERCKSFGKGEQGKRLAQQHARKIEAELLTGVYGTSLKKTWTEFRAEYMAKVVSGLSPRTQEEITAALDHFERLVKPGLVSGIKTKAVDDYKAARRKERGKKRGTLASPATINKSLRHLRAAFKKARKWGYTTEEPEVEFEREPEKLVRYISPEHFAAVYAACDVATVPTGHPFPAPDWWRGVMVFIYLTGWRISEVLALLRTDLDLATGHCVTRHQDNKGKRDERAPLHPLIVEHLERLAGFGKRVFPWPIEGNADWKKELYGEWHRIQTAAGIELPCAERHEHTDACHRYGFHDLRRAFATENAEQLTPKMLQKWMRHKSFNTTLKYIAMAESKMDAAVPLLRVPDLKRATG